MFKKLSLFTLVFAVIFCLVSISSVNAYVGDSIVESIEDESPDIWEVSNSGWTFKAGVVSVCFDKGKVRIEFVYSERNKNFYEQTFSNGKRKPLGFEIELKDLSGSLSKSRLYPSNDNIPNEAQYEDTPFGDGDQKSLTVAVSDPNKLSANKLYWAEFDCSELIYKSSITFSLQVQLTGDFWELKNYYNYLFREYNNRTRELVNLWFFGKNTPNPANRFFVIHKPDERIHETFEVVGKNLVYWMGLNENDKHRHNYSCSIFPFLGVYGGNATINEQVKVSLSDDETGNDFNLPSVTTPNPYTKSADIHITHCKIRPYKEGSWHHQVDVDMAPG